MLCYCTSSSATHLCHITFAAPLTLRRPLPQSEGNVLNILKNLWDGLARYSVALLMYRPFEPVAAVLLTASKAR